MSRWLGSLEPQALAGILIRRPEGLAPPLPRTLGDLANRLSREHHVREAIQELCAPALQTLEAARALLPLGGDSVARAEVAALLGRAADDTEVEAALQVLYQRAFAWPHGDRVVLAGPLRAGGSNDLALGRPAAALLSGRTLEDVRRTGTLLGCRMAGRSKADAISTVAARLGDRRFVRELAATAPGDLGAELIDMATDSPVAIGSYGYTPEHLRWALDRGLLISAAWSVAEMPREVSLALRGPNWHAPFQPRPPLPPSVVPSDEAVARDAAAAVALVLDGVAAVVEAAPIARLKSDGVGVREMQRLARGRPEGQDGVALWLALAGGAGLLTVTPDGYLATPEFDGWLAEAPAERLATLLESWLDVPLLWSNGAPLRADPAWNMWPRLRQRLLKVLADLHGALPEDGSLVDPLLRWHAPRALPTGPTASSSTAEGLWTEMNLLGVVACGVLSPLGRALVEGSDVRAAATALVTPPSDRAVFQADLTAVVAGSPAPDLNRLLDGCADREARGAASVWRFSPASVRRALDAGHAPDELIDHLRAVGKVPQALEYLVRDVGRRHGALRVRCAGCVLHSDDEALLAEVAADRRLRALALNVVAPTVLVSAKPAAETLASLRAAGYAPAGENASGALVLEVPPQRRATGRASVHRASRDPVPARPVDAVALATRLLDGSAEPVPEAVPDPVLIRSSMRDHIASGAPNLDPSEVDLLMTALETEEAVRIEYVDSSGRFSDRVVEPLELEGTQLLHAWCHLRDDERMFTLSRIWSVSAP
jgi:hypothetical protein